MTLPANVTPLSEGRALTQERVTYRAADGKRRETYLGIPSSLLPRLYEATLAEVRLLLYVWQRTGGWKGYHTDPQPVRITFAEWMGGRPGYAQDTGAHLCKQEVAATRDALIARGWLYEEWETPHERGPRRYALVAPDNSGICPREREDGQWEVLLLTEEGPHPYLVPAPVLWCRKEEKALLHHRTGALLPPRKASPTTQESRVLQHRREKTRRSFPGAGRAQPIPNVLTNSSTKEELAKGAADAAPALEHSLKDRKVEQPDAPSPSEHGGSGDTHSSAVGAAPAPPAPLSKPSLFPTQTHAPAPALRSAARTGKQAERGHGASEPGGAKDKTEEQTAQEARKAALCAVWLAHQATVQPEQMSQTERRRFYSGIAKLAQSSLTLEELPALLDAQARWSRGTYTPDPHTLEASLGTLRREAAAWNKQGTTLQKGTNHVGPYAAPRGPDRGPHPAGLAGTGGANHDGDAAILAAVQRVRARHQQEAAASVEPGHDPPGR